MALFDRRGTRLDLTCWPPHGLVGLDEGEHAAGRRHGRAGTLRRRPARTTGRPRADALVGCTEGSPEDEVLGRKNSGDPVWLKNSGSNVELVSPLTGITDQSVT